MGSESLSTYPCICTPYVTETGRLLERSGRLPLLAAGHTRSLILEC